jgi:porin
MRINLLILFTLFTFFCFSNLSAQKQKDSIKVCPVEFSATYVGDVVGNTIGGITTGVKYLGTANLSISLETEKANWWKGGQFYVKGGNTHGASPSEELIGEFQIISNIDGGGNHTYLFECWYKQKIGNVNLTFGLQDLNAEFANTDNASYYINSSFGIPSTIPENDPLLSFLSLQLDCL